MCLCVCVCVCLSERDGEREIEVRQIRNESLGRKFSRNVLAFIVDRALNYLLSRVSFVGGEKDEEASEREKSGTLQKFRGRFFHNFLR